MRYAVERFFAKNIGLQRKCTWESWKIRVGKGNEKNRQRFTYVFPAPVMELPGEWVRVAGMIDSRGVCIKRVQILREHPCFASEAI